MTVAVVGVAIGTVAIALPRRLSEPWWLEAGLVAVLLVAVNAAVVDTVSHRIPNRLVLASLVPTVAVLAVRIGSDGVVVASDVLFGAAAFALPLLAAHVASPAALGFGDVKLAGALGAAVGLVDWRYSVVALCIASGLTAAAALVGRRSEMPFAPGLVGGTALVLVLAIFEGSPT